MFKKIYIIITVGLFGLNYLNAVETVKEIVETYRSHLPVLAEEGTQGNGIIRFLKYFHPKPEVLEGDEHLGLRLDSMLEEGLWRNVPFAS